MRRLVVALVLGAFAATVPVAASHAANATGPESYVLDMAGAAASGQSGAYTVLTPGQLGLTEPGQGFYPYFPGFRGNQGFFGFGGFGGCGAFSFLYCPFFTSSAIGATYNGFGNLGLNSPFGLGGLGFGTGLGTGLGAASATAFNPFLNGIGVPSAAAFGNSPFGFYVVR